MLESLPEGMQERAVEQLREYIADLQDELQWDTLFKMTQSQLIAAARHAKQKISEGQAEPLSG